MLSVKENNEKLPEKRGPLFFNIINGEPHWAEHLSCLEYLPNYSNLVP